MTAYVVASLIPASKQHSPFLAIRAAFSTPEAAKAWASASGLICDVAEVPMDPEPPKVDAPAPCEAVKA